MRTTDPSQFVLSRSGILVLCDITTETYAVSLGGETGSGLALTNETLSGRIAVEDVETGEPLGDAVVDVTFTRGKHVEIRTQEGPIRVTRVGFLLTPTGTITLPTSPATVVDMSSCFAFDGREQQKEHRPDEA